MANEAFEDARARLNHLSDSELRQNKGGWNRASAEYIVAETLISERSAYAEEKRHQDALAQNTAIHKDNQRTSLLAIRIASIALLVAIVSLVLQFLQRPANTPPAIAKTGNDSTLPAPTARTSPMPLLPKQSPSAKSSDAAPNHKVNPSTGLETPTPAAAQPIPK
jgi:hypothetical protein